MARHTFDLLLETIGIVLLIALTLIVVVAVGARRLDISMAWYDEVASIMLSWLTYYGAALAALKRGHMGFSGLFLILPPGSRRLAFVASEILVIGFFVLLGWKGYEVLAIMEGTSLVSLPWVPVAFTQSIVPIGAILFIIAELFSMPEAWRRAFAGLDVHDEEIERTVREAVEKGGDNP